MRNSLLLLVLLLASCASSGRSVPHAGSVLPNEAGRQQYLAALRAWEQAEATGEQPIQALIAARGALRMAQATDPSVPLYHCREGLVALELAGHYGRIPGASAESAEYLGLAERAFQAALKLSPSWSPAHRGLAELARREGRHAAEARHLAQAESAAAAMEAAWTADAAGLEARPFGRSARSSETAPTHAEELAILRGQLTESERWEQTDQSLAQQDALAAL